MQSVAGVGLTYRQCPNVKSAVHCTKQWPNSITLMARSYSISAANNNFKNLFYECCITNTKQNGKKQDGRQ